MNVWLALTHDRHAHHALAARWLEGRADPPVVSPFTQVGLLRLLTNEQVTWPPSPGRPA